MEFDRAGFDREVGRHLQRARRERGITQEELASRIGLPRPSYANIESGRQRVPLDVVWRAAVVLGLSMDALVPEPLPGRADPIPPFAIAAAVTSPSPSLANMTTFGTAAAPSGSAGFMAWRESPDSTDD